MKQFKGTKGEWKASDHYIMSNEEFIIDLTAKESKIPGYDFAQTYGITLEEARANAQLIAAAPELLENLQHLMNLIPVGDELRKGYTWSECNKAISKALGE